MRERRKDLFLLGGAELCDSILLGLAFGGLFIFGSLRSKDEEVDNGVKGGNGPPPSFPCPLPL